MSIWENSKPGFTILILFLEKVKIKQNLGANLDVASAFKAEEKIFGPKISLFIKIFGKNENISFLVLSSFYPPHAM